MDKVKAFLTKRVAGIPVLVPVVFLAALVLFMSFRMRPKGGDAEADDSGSGTDEATDDADAGTDGLREFQTAQTPVVSTGALSGYSEPTNDKWLRTALEWLILNRNAREDFARNALTKYLNGEDLTATEGQLKDAAVAQFGLPPVLPTSGATENNAVPPKVVSDPDTAIATKPVAPKVIPKQATPKPTAPVKRYHTVVKGDTMNKIGPPSKLKAFPENAYIYKRDAQGDKIYPGDKVRVA